MFRRIFKMSNKVENHVIKGDASGNIVDDNSVLDPIWDDTNKETKPIHMSVTLNRMDSMYNDINDFNGSMSLLSLYANETILVEPSRKFNVNSWISVKLPEGVMCLIKETPEMLKEGFHVLGGLLDETHNGDIDVTLINSSDKAKMIAEGDKIGQLFFIPTLTVDFNKTELQEKEEIKIVD